jgi:DNA replication protein DnaC
MSAAAELSPSTLDRIRNDLVGLKMPRALEALDHIVRRLEQGEIGALEAIDVLLAEELTLRENSRIKTALRMGRLATIKTLAGSDFSFQPSLDRDRILALAQLGFIARCEVVHFLGPPGTGKSHLRAWLLQRFKLKLRDLRFEELCAVAEAAQKNPAEAGCR